MTFDSGRNEPPVRQSDEIAYGSRPVARALQTGPAAAVRSARVPLRNHFGIKLIAVNGRHRQRGDRVITTGSLFSVVG
jgi:hypothetical protein